MSGVAASMIRAYETPLNERLRAAANSRALYRENDAYRLAAINRDRRKRGLPILASLADSAALRLPR